LSPILVTAASAVFLKEEIATRAWIASGLIGIGIGLVASF
jgi:EamA-like transporter family.